MKKANIVRDCVVIHMTVLYFTGLHTPHLTYVPPPPPAPRPPSLPPSSTSLSGSIFQNASIGMDIPRNYLRFLCECVHSSQRIVTILESICQNPGVYIFGDHWAPSRTGALMIYIWDTNED